MADSIVKIRILLADDHTIFRQGLRALLEAEDDLKIVGEAWNGAQAVTLAKTLTPDIIVMDIGMPQLNGLQATQRIVKEQRRIKVIVLSMSDEESDVQRAIDAGVRGYLVKQTAASDLISAIREVNRGNAFFSPSIAKVLIKQQKHPVGGKSEQGELTRREVEVLQLISKGKTSREICELLFLSVKTVEKHRQQIMDKLDIHEVAGLTRYAIAHGIVE